MISKLKARIGRDAHLVELLKGSYIAFGMKLFGLLLSYIMILLISKGYGAKAVGTYSLAFAVLQISTMVSLMGLDTYLLRYVSASIDDTETGGSIEIVYRKVIGFLLLGSTTVSVIIYLISALLAQSIFHKPQMTDAFRFIAAAIVPMALIALHRQAIRGVKKILWYAYFNNASIPLFTSLSLLAAIYLGIHHPLTPIVAVVASIFVSATVAMLVWKKQLRDMLLLQPADDKRPIDTPAVRGIFKISIPMMVTSSTFFIMNWVDMFVLGVFETPANIGIYAVALKVAMLTSISLVAVSSIAAPKVSQLWSKGDLVGLREVVHQSTSMTLLSALPLLLVFLILPSWILGLFGGEFNVGAEILMILAIGQFVNAVCGPVGIILSMTGHQIIAQNIIICTAIVNLVLSVTLVQIYGVVGVAIATMVSTVLWNVLMNYFMWKKFGFISVGLKWVK